METHRRATSMVPSLTRRQLLQAGAAAAAIAAEPIVARRPPRAQGKRGGILRVRGYDPPHFDPHLTLNFKTNTTLSFVYSKLVRHKVGARDHAGNLRHRARPGRALGGARRHDRGLSPASRVFAGRTSRPSTGASSRPRT